MSEQNDPQEQDQHPDTPQADAGEQASEERTDIEERTADESQQEIDRLEANGVDDLQGTEGVTEVTEKVNRAEGPVL